MKKISRITMEKSQTIQKIDEIVSRVNTHPECSSCVNREVSHALREEAERHSLDIELLGERKRLTRKQRTKLLERLGKADEFLGTEGISNFSLSKLGSITEPDNNPTGSFRNTQLIFGGFWPPEAKNIPYEMDNLVHFLTETDVHPVLRASNAHLELVRIHPYSDGNGRSARLLQNFCLRQREYPVAVIPSKEREEYIRVMENVLKDRYNFRTRVDNQSEAERKFHEFIALKVFNSALVLERELMSRRMYKVDLKGVQDHSVLYGVAKRIRGAGNLGRGVSVSVLSNGNKKSGSLEIIGNLGSEDVRRILNPLSERKRFDYSVKARYC